MFKYVVIKMAVLWVVAHCSWLKFASVSEVLAASPADGRLHTHRRENLRSFCVVITCRSSFSGFYRSVYLQVPIDTNVS
jgi:hypothetical protein